MNSTLIRYNFFLFNWSFSEQVQSVSQSVYRDVRKPAKGINHLKQLINSCKLLSLQLRSNLHVRVSAVIKNKKTWLDAYRLVCFSVFYAVLYNMDASVSRCVIVARGVFPPPVDWLEPLDALLSWLMHVVGEPMSSLFRPHLCFLRIELILTIE